MFEKIIPRILKAEGSTYTNRPTDKGGPTKYGITQKTLAEYMKRPVTPSEVEAITETLAKTIYLEKYWLPMDLELVSDEGIQLLLFDQGVNRGPKTAVILAQQVLNVLGNNLDVDGDIGPATAGALNRAPVIGFYREFLQACEHAYVDIVKRDPTQIEYLRGWLNRIHNLQDIVWGGNPSVDLTPIEKPKQEEPPAKPKTLPPWYTEAKKYEGKKETDSAFNKFLSAKWPLVGLNLKTIAANWAAWCGLAMATVLAAVGLNWQKDGAAAKNWAKYGTAIEWKTNGIPRGAIVHINHKSQCTSAANNHVAQADGDCAPADLLKPNAVINLYGGNQGNAWKVSAFPVNDICAVRWPEKPADPKVAEKSWIPPRKIIKSDRCNSSTKSSGDSTVLRFPKEKRPKKVA